MFRINGSDVMHILCPISAWNHFWAKITQTLILGKFCPFGLIPNVKIPEDFKIIYKAINQSKYTANFTVGKRKVDILPVYKNRTENIQFCNPYWSNKSLGNFCPTHHFM